MKENPKWLCQKKLCLLNFVYKMYTKVFRNGIHSVCKHSVYILYTFCIQNLEKFVDMWNTCCIQTFRIYFVYINSDLQKVYIINIMYTMCMQNSYRIYLTNNYIQNRSLISTCLTCLLCALPSQSLLQTIKIWNFLANHGS